MTRLVRMLRKRGALSCLEAYLQERDVTYTIGHGGKHPYVAFDHEGRHHRLPLAASPRERHGRRAQLNALQQLRRIVP